MKWFNKRKDPVEVTLAAVAEAGDVLIVAFKRTLTDEEVDGFTEAWQPLVDQGLRIAFVDSAQSITVFKPGKEEPDAHDGV